MLLMVFMNWMLVCLGTYVDLPAKFLFLLSTGRKKSRRGKLVQMTALKPRGADGGPMRTPPNLGDAWQKQASYDVEEVCLGVPVFRFCCCCC